VLGLQRPPLQLQGWLYCCVCLAVQLLVRHWPAHLLHQQLLVLVYGWLAPLRPRLLQPLLLPAFARLVRLPYRLLLPTAP
jgi:hypothetical protein